MGNGNPKGSAGGAFGIVRNHIEEHSLTISVRSDHDSLTVSNPIQPKLTHSGGTGIGLVNLSKRYNLLYKKDISIKEDASIFSVTIPLI